MITIIGAGSWGTALASVLVANGHHLTICARDQNLLTDLINNHNSKYFPTQNKIFDNLDKISVTTNLLEAVTCKTKYIVIALPSKVFTSTIAELSKYISKEILAKIIIVSATKGLTEAEINGVTEPVWLHTVVASYLGVEQAFCTLSGPSFAKEVIQKQPTAVVAAAKKINIAKAVAEIFHNNWFRVYTRTDVLGVQLGGAVKNILAFAVGCSDGVGFGSNARAALITRGLHEMLSLGSVLGAEQETLMGLSGLGDLVLTATDEQSRNKRFGYYIGQGDNISDALKKIHQNVESLETTKLIYKIAQKYKIDMPITEQAYHVLYDNLSVAGAIGNLANRPQKLE